MQCFPILFTESITLLVVDINHYYLEIKCCWIARGACHMALTKENEANRLTLQQGIEVI
jgi:hypothetical protein